KRRQILKAQMRVDRGAAQHLPVVRARRHRVLEDLAQLRPLVCEKLIARPGVVCEQLLETVGRLTRRGALSAHDGVHVCPLFFGRPSGRLVTPRMYARCMSSNISPDRSGLISCSIAKPRFSAPLPRAISRVGIVNSTPCWAASASTISAIRSRPRSRT